MRPSEGEADMSDEQPKKPGLRARRREKMRLKRERTGDSPEKREQPSGHVYDDKDAGSRAGMGGVIGAGFGSG